MGRNLISGIPEGSERLERPLKRARRRGFEPQRLAGQRMDEAEQTGVKRLSVELLVDPPQLVRDAPPRAIPGIA